MTHIILPGLIGGPALTLGLGVAVLAAGSLLSLGAGLVAECLT